MQTVIAKRSDMLVMSTEGPLSAYVNPHGYVHEIMTLYRANGLALRGRAETEYSWFPGYEIDLTSLFEPMSGLFLSFLKKLTVAREVFGRKF